MNDRWVLFALIAALGGCGGYRPDNVPGESTMLLGRVAVDPDTETAFAVDFSLQGVLEQVVSRAVVAVRPDGGAAVDVQALEADDFPGIAFSPGRVLITTHQIVSGTPDGGDAVYQSTLRAFDAGSFEPLGEMTLDGILAVVSTSSSRRWALGWAEDQTSGRIGSWLIDLQGLVAYDVANSSVRSLTFGHQTDRVFAIVETPDGDHLRSWSISTLIDRGFELDDDGGWTGASIDVTMQSEPGADAVLREVSPTDESAVVASEPGLLWLVDLIGGEQRVLDEAISGPVFTPDGSSLVGYDPGVPQDGEMSRLIEVDVETGETTFIELPYAETPNFFVSRGGHDVVVAPLELDGQSLVLVDLDTGSSRSVGGTSVHLDEFTSRIEAGEIWFLQDDVLFCLNLADGRTDLVFTPDYDPFALNILPAHDQLVMQAGSGIVLFDPSARSVIRSVPLH